MVGRLLNALCIYCLEVDGGTEAKGSCRYTVTQMYSERMFQANLRISVFVSGDTAIPGDLLSNKIPKGGGLSNLSVVTLPKIFL